MFVNQSISLLISVNFSFVFTWTNPDILYSRYEKDRRLILENPNIILNDMCKANKQVWAATCKKAIRLLRKDDAPENPYRYSLYMNYQAFNFSPQCGIIKIRISSEQLVDQPVSYCYGRPSVIPSTGNAWIGNWPHFNEISIYFGIGGTMMVFQCKGVECLLLEWYKAEEWLQLRPVGNIFFDRLVPETMINDERELAVKLFHSETVSNWNNNNSNILWKLNINGREKLCEMLYTRAEYKSKIIFSQEIPSDQPFVTSRRTKAVLVIQIAGLRKKVEVEVFVCIKFKTLYGVCSSQYYKLMAGPGNDSVILLEPLRPYKGHKAIEWVRNLFYYNSVNIDQNY